MCSMKKLLTKAITVYFYDFLLLLLYFSYQLNMNGTWNIFLTLSDLTCTTSLSCLFFSQLWEKGLNFCIQVSMREREYYSILFYSLSKRILMLLFIQFSKPQSFNGWSHFQRCPIDFRTMKDYKAKTKSQHIWLGLESAICHWKTL